MIYRKSDLFPADHLKFRCGYGSNGDVGGDDVRRYFNHGIRGILKCFRIRGSHEH